MLFGSLRLLTVSFTVVLRSCVFAFGLHALSLVEDSMTNDVDDITVHAARQRSQVPTIVPGRVEKFF